MLSIESAPGAPREPPCRGPRPAPPCANVAVRSCRAGPYRTAAAAQTFPPRRAPVSRRRVHADSRERAAAPAPGARRGGAPAVRRHLTGLAADRADIHSFLQAHHHRRTEVLCPLGTEHKPYPRPKLPSLICTQPAATGRTSVCAAARGAARGRSPAAPRAWSGTTRHTWIGFGKQLLDAELLESV